MPIENQSDCYRTIEGKRWPNLCDMLAPEHVAAVADARSAGFRVMIRKHPDGYRQAFVEPEYLELDRPEDEG